MSKISWSTVDLDFPNKFQTDESDVIMRVRSFLDREWNSTQKDSKVGIPSLELRKRAGKQMLASLDLPRDLGGENLSNVGRGACYEQLGRTDLDARDTVTSGHGVLLQNMRPDACRDYWAERIALGGLIGLATTEPSGGSDLRGLTATAKERAGGYLLNGVKGPMSRLEAEAFVVMALSEGALEAFWVPSCSRGLHTQQVPTLGLEGWHFGYIELRDVWVPRNNRLTESGGQDLLRNHFATWRPMVGLLCLGAAEQSLCEAARHLNVREVFGKRLSDMPLPVHDLGRHTTEVNAARLLSYEALAEADLGKSSETLAAQAKAKATQVSFDAVNWCLQMFGAVGYTDGLQFSKRLRDIRGMCIADGPNDVLLITVGRTLVRRFNTDS